MTTAEILERIRPMQDGDSLLLLGVHIWRTRDVWWVQQVGDGSLPPGGVQFSKTPDAAAIKARRLITTNG